MKYYSSARPSAVGKSNTVRIRTFSATLVYPETPEQVRGKRIRSQKGTKLPKGKFDRRRSLPHVEWCRHQRKKAKDFRQGARSRTHIQTGSQLSRRFTSLTQFVEDPVSSGLSGGSGTKVNMSCLRAYAARTVFLESWPARVVKGVLLFFDRLQSGLCLHCGNHSGEWGFWVIGCHLHAVHEVSRLRDAAAIVTSVIASLEYRVHDDFEALAWGRQSLINLGGQYIRLQERIATIWGGLATMFLPTWLRRGYNLASFTVDMGRLGVIVGSTRPDDWTGLFRLPSSRSMVKSAAKALVTTDPVQVMRELVGRKECGDLVVLLTTPDEFVLNTKRVQFLFSRLGGAELLVNRVTGWRPIKLTRDERDLLFILSKLYKGITPDYRKVVGVLFTMRWWNRAWFYLPTGNTESFFIEGNSIYLVEAEFRFDPVAGIIRWQPIIRNEQYNASLPQCPNLTLHRVHSFNDCLRNNERHSRSGGPVWADDNDWWFYGNFKLDTEKLIADKFKNDLELHRSNCVKCKGYGKAIQRGKAGKPPSCWESR